MISLNISNLRHEYDGREVFSSINLSFEGTCLAITGANGSGKSTIIKIISGLLMPTDGYVSFRVNDQNITPSEIKHKIGICAPYIQLYDELTVRENLEFICKASGIKDSNFIIDESLKEVGLLTRASESINTLSSGLRQRALLSAAIVRSPLILLLDEPETNLDKEGINIIENLINKHRNKGMVILATNNKDEAMLSEEYLELSK